MLSRVLRQPALPKPEDALPGRKAPMVIDAPHFVLGTKLTPPYPSGHAVIVFGMGCFWGAEKKFWSVSGVFTTSVGYAGGYTQNPTYQEVCTGQTGHNEVVQVVFDPSAITLERLLKIFWEGHDPTQGMRQGNDVGTQYRSGIYVSDAEQRDLAERSRDAYGRALGAAGPGAITTEIETLGAYYFAEPYHQQYLAKNPGGYCGLGGTGVGCPVGLTG